MSNTLDREELFSWLYEMLGIDDYVDGGRTTRRDVFSERDIQAYEQIVALIKSGNE